MDTVKRPVGKPKSDDPLVKPMHLRLTVASEAHIREMARVWGMKRQDAVRRIVKMHMRAKSRSGER